MESLLLLFTESLPCWDEESVKVAGENPESLKALANAGYIMPLSGGYVLTQKGITAREIAAQELYLPVTPARIITDESEARKLLEINRMSQYLDRAFVTDWGIKEVTTRESFPLMPCLNDDEYFAFDGERIIATWLEHDTMKKFLADFPNYGVAARKFPAPAQSGLDDWAKRNSLQYGTFTADFVMRCRADFNHYKNYPQLESDRYKFLDSDQLFAQKVDGSPEDLLPFVGKLHIFLTLQRRIYLPGWFDIDHDENEDWHLLALVTDSESQLEALTRTLRSWGHELINPVNPLFILGTSIERLRAQKEQERTIYDWFQEETVRIMRPDAPDGE